MNATGFFSFYFGFSEVNDKEVEKEVGKEVERKSKLKSNVVF
jgi:hypothetical protein